MKKEKGFTLLELLVTIVIILILSGIVVPRLDTGFKNQRLDSDAKKLASNLTLAQNYAIGQRGGHRYYGISFYNGYYRIIPYDDEIVPLNAVAAPSSVNANGDIVFSDGITKSSGPQSVIFRFDGSLNADYAPLVLTNNYSTKTLTFTRLTGYININ